MTIKITIPLKNGTRVEIDGNVEYIKDTVNELKSVFGVLETAFGEITIAQQEPIQITKDITPSQEQELIPTGTQGTPVIPEQVKKNLTKSLLYLLNESEWGKNPRTFGDIMEALKTNGLYRSKGSVSGLLSNLTKKSRIRHIRESPKDEWKFLSI